MAKHLPKELTFCFNVKTAWHAIMKMYNTMGIDHDLSASSGFILLNIDPKQGTPVTHIGPAIGMEPKGLTRTLKSFEEKGWIIREADKQDKRMVRVFLTEKGKRKRAISRESVKQFNAALYQHIPEEDIEAFFRVIHILKNQTRQVSSDFVSTSLQTQL
jgi:DNA-binding MarR family transcriptional regulator